MKAMELLCTRGICGVRSVPTVKAPMDPDKKHAGLFVRDLHITIPKVYDSNLITKYFSQNKIKKTPNRKFIH